MRGATRRGRPACTRTACFSLAVITMSDSRGRVRRVLEHELDDAVDLGVDALDGAGVGVGHARAVLDVVEREAAVPEERCPPTGATSICPP